MLNDISVHAKTMTDSFHVLQWLLRLVNCSISKARKGYQIKDKRRIKSKNHDNNLDNQTIKESDEAYLLKHAKRVLLLNPKNWHLPNDAAISGNPKSISEIHALGKRGRKHNK